MAQLPASPFQVDLTQHSAIVTGGGGDIGRAVALALARSGAAVTVNDLNPDGADATAEAIQAAGGRAYAVQGDVANRFQAAALIETARDIFGRPTILVNAASVFRDGPLAGLDEWDWRRILDVNLTGAFFCTQLIGRVMADEGGGCIVQVAAAPAVSSTLPDGVSYMASKSGLLGLMRQSARELGPAGVRVNAVCPGWLEDDFGAELPQPVNALARRGLFDEVAGAVLFLCSDAASFITGQALTIDGGGY